MIEKKLVQTVSYLLEEGFKKSTAPYYEFAFITVATVNNILSNTPYVVEFRAWEENPITIIKVR